MYHILNGFDDSVARSASPTITIYASNNPDLVRIDQGTGTKAGQAHDDHGHHQYLPISYPVFDTAAAFSWNAAASNKFDGAAAFGVVFVEDPITTHV